MIKHKAIWAILIFSLLCNQYLFSCDCYMRPLKMDVIESQYIIVVTKNNPKENDLSSESMSVDEVLKGDLNKNRTIEIVNDSLNYTIEYKEDAPYLLFLYKKDEKFYVYYCSYSGELSQLKKTYKRIKKILKKIKTQ